MCEDGMATSELFLSAGKLGMAVDFVTWDCHRPLKGKENSLLVKFCLSFLFTWTKSLESFFVCWMSGARKLLLWRVADFSEDNNLVVQGRASQWDCPSGLTVLFVVGFLPFWKEPTLDSFTSIDVEMTGLRETG